MSCDGRPADSPARRLANRVPLRRGLVSLLIGLSGLRVGPVSAETDALAVAVHARSIQPGELVLLTVTTPEAAASVTARAFGHHLPAYAVGPTSWQVLVAIDLDIAPGAYSVITDATIGTRRLETITPLDVHDKAFPTRQLAVADAFVNPPETESKRIAAEAARLDALWHRDTPRRLWEGPFVRPVADPANSAFGSRSIFNGQPRAPHSGADFLSPAGTPVHAPAGGTVVVAGALYYTGNTVVIDHGLGVYSMFAHFSAIDVHEGDTVTAGQVVGKVGATGRVTGPHLHWALRVGTARVDPLSALAVLGPGTASPGPPAR
jgi:murein DD-endopeptidase MepM/ murein hydrolase activator NlpD